MRSYSFTFVMIQMEVPGLRSLRPPEPSQKGAKVKVEPLLKDDSSALAEEERRKLAEKHEAELLERLRLSAIPRGSITQTTPNQDTTAVTVAPGLPAVSSPTPTPVTTTKRVVTKAMQVTPTPGYVMKSKNAEGDKVFINVCGHELLDSSPGEIFLSSRKQAADKTGGMSAVYDAVLAANLIKTILTDESGEQQQKVLSCVTTDCTVVKRLFNQAGVRILQRVNEVAKEQLDMAFTTPLIKGNYKGDRVTETQIVVKQEESVVDSPPGPPATTPKTPSSTKIPFLGGGGSKKEVPPPEEDGQYVIPVPGFVINTRDTNTESAIFINLCSHELVPFAERPVMLTSAPRVDETNNILVFDAVVHPSTLSNITSVKNATLREASLQEVGTALLTPYTA